MRKYRVKRIGIILFLVVLSFIELCWDLEIVGLQTRWPLLLFIVLAVVDLFVEIRKAFSGSKESEQQADALELYCRYMDRATMWFFAVLDKGIHKINPDYDPDAERNARRAVLEERQRIDELWQAGLIDEMEYKRRKNELQ